MIPEHANVIFVPGGTGNSLVRGVVGGMRVKVHPVSKLRSVWEASSSLVSESKAKRLLRETGAGKELADGGGPKGWQGQLQARWQGTDQTGFVVNFRT